MINTLNNYNENSLCKRSFKMLWLHRNGAIRVVTHLLCDGLSGEMLSHPTMCYEDKGCGEDKMETQAQEKKKLPEFTFKMESLEYQMIITLKFH